MIFCYSVGYGVVLSCYSAGDVGLLCYSTGIVVLFCLSFFGLSVILLAKVIVLFC